MLHAIAFLDSRKIFHYHCNSDQIQSNTIIHVLVVALSSTNILIFEDGSRYKNSFAICIGAVSNMGTAFHGRSALQTIYFFKYYLSLMKFGLQTHFAY